MQDLEQYMTQALSHHLSACAFCAVTFAIKKTYRFKQASTFVFNKSTGVPLEVHDPLSHADTPYSY